MALSDYSNEELLAELAKRETMQPDYVHVFEGIHGGALTVEYGEGQKSLTFKHSLQFWRVNGEDLRRLSIMVSHARHNGGKNGTKNEK